MLVVFGDGDEIFLDLCFRMRPEVPLTYLFLCINNGSKKLFARYRFFWKS